MSRAAITLAAVNLGADGELSYTPDGKPKFEMRVAVNNGRDEDPTWYTCTAWQNYAETLSKLQQDHGALNKGDNVTIFGTLKLRSFTDKQGNARIGADVSVNFVELGGKSANNSGGGQQQQAATPSRPASRPQRPGTRQAPVDNDDDDI